MGYYVRVFGINDLDIHLDELVTALKAERLAARIACAEGSSSNNWNLIQVWNERDTILCNIERNAVFDGQLGEGELEEFREEIELFKPRSAVDWLKKFFDNVRVIYAFQLFNAAFEEDNFELITVLKTAIWNKAGGILQADNEGFSNQDGYHILWQFDEDVDGDWSCALLQASGEWERFVMDLGDITQCAEFREGKIPSQARKIS